jgi:8-oxo-dGTP diphosphatase
MTLSSEFHRSKFERADDAAPLVNELARVLTERLCKAADPSATIAGIVRELRDLGHEIYSWDASDDFETWGDSWIQPHPPKRLILEFSFREDEPRSVEVTFGPWPTHVPNPSCPICGIEMKGGCLNLSIQGHGAVSYEALPYSLSIGGAFKRSGTVGNRSIRVQQGILECPQCHGVWLKGSDVSDEIDKLAWLYIEEKRLLAARSRGKVAYYIPGGKREPGESDQEALIREIREELSVDLLPGTIELAGEFKAQADGKPEGRMVRMTCYQAGFRGEIRAAAEIEEVVWIGYEDRERCSPVGKVILDWLKERGMID